MIHAQWWLIILAFVLGLVMTFALTIRRVKRDVPVGAWAGGAAGARSPVAVEDDTTRVLAQPEAPTRTLTDDAPTEFISTGDAPTSVIPKADRSAAKMARMWWAVSGVVLVATLAAAGTTLFVRSQHRPVAAEPGANVSTAKGAPTVYAAALPGLLLSPQQLADMIGAPKMVVHSSVDMPQDDRGADVLFGKNADCLGGLRPAIHSAYANTGWNAARIQGLTDTADALIQQTLHYSVEQGVISFSSVDAARKALADLTSLWSFCSGRTMTMALPGKPLQRSTLGSVTDKNGIVSMTNTREGDTGWRCQRAMTTRSNVIVDIMACRADLANQGLDILNAIAAKIPH